MIPIQEVEIFSDNGIKISAHVVVPTPNSLISEAEILVHNPSIGTLHSAYQKIGQYPDPKSAYKIIIELAKQHIEKSEGSIVRVNNPCNTEFVSPEDQQLIIDELSINLKIEVNT